nr:hypothetical protein [Tanacetum cinerariifolium]
QAVSAENPRRAAAGLHRRFAVFLAEQPAASAGARENAGAGRRPFYRAGAEPYAWNEYWLKCISDGGLGSL